MTKEIPLSKGKVAFVSDHRHAELSRYKWYCITTHGIDYAYRKAGSGIQIGMHNQIAAPPPGFITDHKDRNGLNNTDDNLRVSTESQNRANQRLRKDSTTGFKGVSLDKRSGKYSARIKVNKMRIHLGCFTDLKDAARAYDNAARDHFGEFAKTNFSEFQK